MMATHNLKCWPEYFSLINAGVKNFDLRKNDRGFRLGDDIKFEEFRPGVNEYTGRHCKRRVSYILSGFAGLEPGYCILELGRA